MGARSSDPTTDEGGTTSARPGAYEAARPYVVVDSLDDLAGPTTGVVELPVTLDRGPNPRYDLDDPRRRERLYTVVVRQAQCQRDLRQYLDGDLLVEAWPRMVLPPRCSDAWHARFPTLMAVGTGRGRT